MKFLIRFFARYRVTVAIDKRRVTYYCATLAACREWIDLNASVADYAVVRKCGLFTHSSVIV